MFLAKGKWNCERRQYSSVSDQPDERPIDMRVHHDSIQRYICMESRETHHGLHRAEQFPHCGNRH
jgi:hypothetical protein